MELQREGDGFRVTDAAKNTVRVGTDGWDESVDAPSVADVVSFDSQGSEVDSDVTVSGAVERLVFPRVYVYAERVDVERPHKFDEQSCRLELDEGSHLLRVIANIEIQIRFDGSATLTRDGDDRIELSFDRPTPVSLRFHSEVTRQTEQITVGSNPAELAEALPFLSTPVRRTDPDRTWPQVRRDPPTIELGESLQVPETIRDRHEPTDTCLVVPPELEYLFTAAPLVYYLGGTVTLDETATPALDLDGRRVTLGRLPAFQYNVASVLRRVFYLDCLAREAGTYGEWVSLSPQLETLGLDADRLYDAPMAERVEAYVDAPFEDVSEEFPEWNLTMYVEPSYRHVETLPHLLETLPFVMLPESEELSKAEWISLSMDDSYEHGEQVANPREPTDESFTRLQREISNVELVNPVLGPSRYHGWLAENVPIDVFKTFPEAYENRRNYLDDSPISVVAVLNNTDMRQEHDAALDRYEQRADTLGIDIDVRENITSAQLARVFESRNDLVHFIGHSDDRGLECADGFLSIESVSESNTQTFFLNACGSYHEGVGLVRKGSVAGGVTFEAVTDSQAAEVGTTFARLMVLGYSLERALDKARQQVMTPKDYAVVGDGTHVVTQSESILPLDLRLVETGRQQYRLEVSQIAPFEKGGHAQDRFDGSDGEYHLGSHDRSYELSEQQLRNSLDIVENPILFDGGLYWPNELREQL
ncbi:MAG: hypothetical protein J07HB67_01025 [halophilic archaeon J07HB67]|jgi:hypothetical protein|nr:MAG: hypothetical protein J07HB67_01025 [halophilic archaeon J07HB67]